MIFLATVYSHFGAIRLRRELKKEGIEGTLQPVPRALSSSCGTCLRFDAPPDFRLPAYLREDVEKLAEETAGGYRVLEAAEEGP